MIKKEFLKMSVLYLILFVFAFCFLVCSLVSIVQFVVDVCKTAKLKKELNDLIKKYNLFDVSADDDKNGGVEND